MDNLEKFIREHRSAFDTDSPSPQVWENVERSLEPQPDRLEKFILEHRAEFDTASPGLKVWAEIDKKLERQPIIRRLVWLRRLQIAAAVALLLVAGGVGGAYLAGATNPPKSLTDLSPEYGEMERYFQSQVTEKMAQLASYRQDGYVKGDLQELDGLYRDLQKDLSEAPSGSEQQVIEAMINTYKTKIEILEQVLEKVQSTIPSNLKTEENEVSI